MSWKDHPSPKDKNEWNNPDITPAILGSEPESVPLEYVQHSARRLNALRNHMREKWIGLEDVIDLLLATVIARENPLMLGPPGVAKTEIATQLFKFIGLQQARKSHDVLEHVPIQDQSRSFIEWWDAREEKERRIQKYFHLTMNRYTQPEELFGPIEIDLLKRGGLVRVNFGFMTSRGVLGAFLDEIFKASGSILNALLSLTNERLYFNWGGMVQSDLMVLIGASNELPGGLATSNFVRWTGSEDFPVLHAFLDRFPIRLLVEYPPLKSKNFQIKDSTSEAIKREARRFCLGDAFENPSADKNMPVINDLLLLGRAMMQHLHPSENGKPKNEIFEAVDLKTYEDNFYLVAKNLLQDRTNLRHGNVTWTLSPRKLKAIYKVGLAYALLQDQGFSGGKLVRPLPRHLQVFKHIWDSTEARDALEGQVKAVVGT